jgi:hypothetical protein
MLTFLLISWQMHSTYEDFRAQTVRDCPFLDSTASPSKTLGSGINQKMVEKSARLQLDSSKSESGGYGGYHNQNLSVAEEAKEDDQEVTSFVEG